MKRIFLLVVCSIIATTLFAQKNTLEGFKTSEQGAKYKFTKTNPQGQQVGKDDLIIGRFTIMFGDSLVADGSKMQSQPLVRADESSKVFKGDLIDGILLMKKGEICTFAFERDSIIKLFGQVPEYFVSGMYAFWTIEIDDIKTPKQQEEQEAMLRQQQELEMAKQKHIADSLTLLEPAIIEKAIKDYGFNNKLVNGVYFKKTLTLNTKNQTPTSGDKVKVHYIGKFTNGKLFDTSVEEAAKEAGRYQQGRPYQPLEFTIGKGMMIPGFEEAVKMMQKGEKATVLIPSKLAYGTQARGEIQPATPLIFELELIEIEKAATPSPASTKSPNQPIKATPQTTKKK
jgi:FKBP-type peptidyl-prolyl cis-trans isomerase